MEYSLRIEAWSLKTLGEMKDMCQRYSEHNGGFTYKFFEDHCHPKCFFPLPIWAKEQCEKHVGSALERGCIYAAATYLVVSALWSRNSALVANDVICSNGVEIWVCVSFEAEITLNNKLNTGNRHQLASINRKSTVALSARNIWSDLKVRLMNPTYSLSIH